MERALFKALGEIRGPQHLELTDYTLMCDMFRGDRVGDRKAGISAVANINVGVYITWSLL